MSDVLNAWFVPCLTCPDCGGELHESPGNRQLQCAGCSATFPIGATQIDCRPSSRANTSAVFPAQQTPPAWPAWTAPPAGIYRGPITERISPRHLSILAARGARRLDVLDWGCGTAEYRPLITRHLGHRYVGIDLSGSAADVLADVHRLPFKTSSLDHVITGAVLEHVSNPFLAVREVARILKSGGVFSGSTAFLEPYHYNSLFHLSAEGVLHVLQAGGFRVEAVWPQETWSVFDSLATMTAPISGISRRLLRLVGRIERLARTRHVHPANLRRGRWLRAKEPRVVHEEMMVLTGQVDFLATKD